MSTSESRSGLVLELAEEFLDRYRKGERPSLKDYIDRNPSLAQEIREVFPAMAMMEKIAIADDSLDADPGATTPALPGSPRLEQLGDFRILREVGRGGMGVVYEAEQVSLGRHVALKVLPQHIVADSRQKHRFEREARAAARLHHTNIVPVFGVGEHEGTPYYVMQFIQGRGLDEVLDELKRLHAKLPPPREGQSDLPTRTASGQNLPLHERDVTAADVARSLLTGRFESAPDLLDPSDSDDQQTEQWDTPDLPPTSPLAPPAHAANSPEIDNLSPASATSSVSILSSSQSGSTRQRNRKLNYWQGVARIGLQVAEALDYAHHQRIVHRDIKPSNLLLDTRGTVWVTDFGLAKADDQLNLTHTGDILGTLRFMPPEAFEGKSDARSDVYSLGLTLYELLALRPAFDEKDRARLVKQVTSEEAPRLRKLRPDVPRDLETIIHKAIERDPAHRYSSATALAADLQHYLADEPIAARRTTLTERAVRWCRRNRVISALAASILLLMTAVTIGSLLTARHMRRLATQAQKSATIAQEQTQAALLAQREAEAATTLADNQRKEAETSFAQARAAVDDYLTKVTESQLLSAPGLQPLRRDLLDSALKFYDEFLKRRDDPTLRAAKARIFLKVGKIQTELGDPKASKQSYDDAIKLYEALSQSAPDNLDFQQGLLQALSSAKLDDRAIEVGERLLKQAPDRRDTREDLASVYNARYVRLSNENKLADALPPLLKSLDLHHQLILIDPANPQYEMGLSLPLNNLGASLTQLNRNSDALPLFRRALTRSLRALAKNPNQYNYGRLSLGYLRNIFARQTDITSSDVTSEFGQSALDLSRKLAAANPGVPIFSEYRKTFAELLADQREQDGKFQEAALLYRETLDPTGQLVFTDPRARPALDPDAFIKLANVLARSETANQDNPSLPESTRIADEAIINLNRHLDSGGSLNIQYFKNSPQAKILQDRPGYTSLIDRIETKTTPSRSSNPTDNQQLRAESLRLTPLLARATELDPQLLARGDRAAARYAEGLIQLGLDHKPEAHVALDEARRLLQQLGQEYPQDPQLALELALTHCAQADLAFAEHRIDDSLRDWDLARQQLARVLEHKTENPLLAAEAVHRLCAIAQTLSTRGFLTESRSFFQLARQSGFPMMSWDLAKMALFCALNNDLQSFNLCYDQIKSLYIAQPLADFYASDFALLFAIMPGHESDANLALQAAEAGVNRVNQDWPITYLGWVHFRAGRYEQALMALDRAIAKNPYDMADNQVYNAYRKLIRAMCLYHLDRQEEARVLLQDARTTRDRSFLRLLARESPDQSFEDYNWVAAIMVFALREAGTLNAGVEPDDQPWMLLYEAWSNARLGRGESTRALLARWPADAAGNPDWLAARAHIYDKLGNPEAARADRAAALQLDPENLLAHVDLGRQAMKANRPREAAEHLVHALDQFQNGRDIASGRWEIDGLLASSDEAFQRAIELRPDDPQLWVARGRYFAWHLQWKEAAAAYARRVPSLSIYADWLEYACTLILAGDIEGYKKLCAQVKDRLENPGASPPMWTNASIYIQAARIATLHPDSGLPPDLILKWANEAYKEQPDFIVTYGLARAELYAGKIQDAADTAAKILDAIAWPGGYLYQFAGVMVLQTQGKTEEARKLFAEANAKLMEREANSAKHPYPPINTGSWLSDLFEGQVLRLRIQALLNQSPSQPSAGNSQP